MDDTNVRVNSAKAWFLAARPKTLSGAAVPVMIGAALAVGAFGAEAGMRPLVLCVLFAFFMQIDANLVNDYFDFMKGTDDDTRLGPKRACAQGWITASAMRMGIAVTTVLACLCGLPLVLYGGWEMIMVGLACVVFCFLYTITLSYIGLGDVLVLVFFGLVPVSMTYWLMSPSASMADIPAHVLLVSLACGCVVDTLLVVNNYRDIDGDRRAGKRTLIVKIGEGGGRCLYLMLGFVAVLLNAVAVSGRGMWAVLLPLAYIPFHVSASMQIWKIRKGAALNRVLGMTARNMVIYGLAVSCGLLL